MLRIILKNGDIRQYHGNAFTDYEWKPNAFIVKKNGVWISIFNWDVVAEIEYRVDE